MVHCQCLCCFYEWDYVAKDNTLPERLKAHEDR